jgi:peptidoglycan/LPS O-acetylase OafA/YrhL
MLRLIAAVSVVFFHYGFRGHAAEYLQDIAYPELAPAAQYGYVGVLLFFMIFGYIIPQSLQRRSAREFAVLRCIRLYSTYCVCAGISLITFYLLSDHRFRISIRDALLNNGSALVRRQIR